MKKYRFKIIGDYRDVVIKARDLTSALDKVHGKFRSKGLPDNYIIGVKIND